MINKMTIRVVMTLLLLYILSAASCRKADFCWRCVNPHNQNEWKDVCDQMTKNKMMKYGYTCTPL